MIELYAITDAAGPPLPDVAQLSAVAHSGLAAICGPSESGELSPERLWRYEEVVEALMRDRDVLPVRYGTRFEDHTTAARTLAERHDQLVRALDRIRGAVEISVRVVSLEDQAACRSELETGTGYLHAKSHRVAREAAAARTVHDPLAAESRASMQRVPAASGEVLRGAYLVERDAIERFVNRVAQLQAENGTLRLLCTGPWPPYSFAEDDE